MEPSDIVSRRVGRDNALEGDPVSLRDLVTSLFLPASVHNDRRLGNI